MKDILIKSIQELYKTHLFLLESNVKEESINFHFANILWKNYSKITTNKREIIDVEYDRYEQDEKTLENRHIRPDILIHERGNDNSNKLAIEIKKKYSSKVDKEKMKEILRPPFCYKYSACIALNIKYRKPYIIVYSQTNKQDIKIPVQINVS
jgi:hypothetical protein